MPGAWWRSDNHTEHVPDVLICSTTGGSGGTTVTVTTLDDLTSAVAGDDKKIVIISGTITGNTVVKARRAY